MIGSDVLPPRNSLYLVYMTSHLTTAIQTLTLEAEAIVGYAQTLRETHDNQAIWSSAHALLLGCKGRIVVAGIGKSAVIAQKFVATLNSTGTPALFLHAADAIHGDLGMVQGEDVVVILSQSGNSSEIRVLAELIRSAGYPLLAITGQAESALARAANVLIHTPIEREACPLGLAPTSSTTLHLAITDALAMGLLEAKGFTPKDFARYHPGGALGKQLYLRAGVLAEANAKPSVALDATLAEVVLSISANRLGATAVVDADNQLLGIITDGDLRRALQQSNAATAHGLAELAALRAESLMTRNPKTVSAETLAVDARAVMRQHSITQLPLKSDTGNYEGMLHLHDLLREGIV